MFNVGASVLRAVKFPIFQGIRTTYFTNTKSISCDRLRSFQSLSYQRNKQPSSAANGGNEWSSPGLENLLAQLQEAVGETTKTNDDMVAGPREEKLEDNFLDTVWPEPANPVEEIINRPFQVDPAVQHLVNMIMRDGKKTKAEKIVATALTIVQKEKGKNPVVLLRQALADISPIMKLITAKRFNKGVEFPIPLKEKQRRRIAIKWVLDSSKSHSSKRLSERLAKEIVAILDNTSSCFKKRDHLHKMCLVNRGNAPIRV
ncbi:ribosomal protein subunit S7 [Schizosaccharomyces cryophilus OY26]|uniref:Ribosomal protein subunit S7 n=1 Tax=Schizosaccharomyces cryophilus (strain OY26 / ATCC MYA-4695 / CBS 11777 / NBRC 106824 / NRRL Y48691) TaxID=653667 RepID=S9W438_SCHCR|nr:ribosomal protein subunit S7 [Schizosaccharomyces cryophilus OY26]EPY52750.1 ribosomal protein subunit S7 [Schizosaccharomyces cryophilus OY26]